MSEAIWLAARLGVLVAVGLAYLWLLGEAVAPWLLPVAWRPFRAVAVPFLGWGALVALAYPLNATLPGRPVLLTLGGIALLAVLVRSVRRSARLPGVAPGWPWAPFVAGALGLVPAITLYAGAGALSAVVADSDVEHFADVVGALLAFPIGWTVEAQMGLESTPIGLAYHYIHAAISAVTGVDTFGTAVPSHLVMVALAPAGVYLFAREALGARPRVAALAAGLSACGGFALGVSSFGWAQQTAALATVPAGLAGVRRALLAEERRDVVAGGLLAALAAGSLYLATAPLIGGAALVCAGLLVPAVGLRRVAERSLGLGLVVALAGALSHLSTAGYFLLGGLGAGDVAGRSTHVQRFVSVAGALGVSPTEPFALTPDPLPALGALAAIAALVLMGTALVHRRSDPLVLGLSITAGMFELYLRVLRPFPYGEFKLVTSVWFVVPVLLAAGVDELGRGRPRLRPVWLSCLALVALGLLLTTWRTRTGLAIEWGAALPEREVDALRAVVARVPHGAAVWVSDQLVPDAAVTWAGVETESRHGFTSSEAGRSYLARRWKGAATSLLSLSGRPAYGLVQRHSTELRHPIAARGADFLLLDASEDPLFFGLTTADLIADRGRLRLFRGDGTALPPATLPIGESMPGRRQGYAVPRTAPPQPTSTGDRYVAHAMWASGETEVTVQRGAADLRLALFPGLTWLVTREATVALTPGGGQTARVVMSRSLRAGEWTEGEQLRRSPAGITSPGVLVSAGTGQTDYRYVNLSDRLVSVAARPQVSDRTWIAGRAAGPSISLDPPFSIATLPIATGASWLEVGPDGRAAVHAPAGTGLFSLPLLGSAAPRVPVSDGTLVKGSSHRLHLVLDGRLHWVPTLEALQRRAVNPPVVTLRDVDLWRLPVGLPLD